MSKLEMLQLVLENHRRALAFAERHPEQRVIGFGRNHGETDVYLQYYTWDEFASLLNGHPLTVQFTRDAAHVRTRVEEGVAIHLVAGLDELPAGLRKLAPQDTVVIDAKEVKDAA